MQSEEWPGDDVLKVQSISNQIALAENAGRVAMSISGSPNDSLWLDDIAALELKNSLIEMSERVATLCIGDALDTALSFRTADKITYRWQAGNGEILIGLDATKRFVVLTMSKGRVDLPMVLCWN